MASGALTERLRETLDVFDDAGIPRTTPEVADCLDLGRRSTYNRLERLVDHDRIETKKVGANARVWWRPPAKGTSKAPDWPATSDFFAADVLGDAAVGVFVLDETFDIAWINDATERYFGLDREHVIGTDKRELIDEHIRTLVDDSETFAETVLATYEDNTYTEHFECHLTPGEGREERWLEHRSKPIESGGYAGGRVELYYDVTDLKRSEQTRRKDRTQFEELVDAVEEYAIFMLDTEGRVETWNTGAEHIKGYTAEEIVGRHFSTFYPPEARQVGVHTQNLSEAAEHGSVEDEGWRVRADGSRFWANVTITAIRDDDGELEGYAKVTRDMTERREREQELRRERDLIEQLVETAPIRFAVFRADGSIERINSQARRQLGIDESAVSEFTIEDLDIHDAQGKSIPSAGHPVSRVFETGEPVSDWLVQHEGPNGKQQWVSLTGAPLYDDDGTVERAVIAGKDVTELKQTEQQIERQRDELEEELDEVFTRIDEAFFALDEDWRFTHVNERAAELVRLPAGELLGALVWDVLPEVAEGYPRAAVERAMETQESFETEFYSELLDIWVEIRGYPSETGMSVYVRDITERKEREQRLEQFERMVETVDDGVYATDGEGNFVFVNDAFVAMSKHTREELLASHGSAFFGERFVDTDEEEWRELVAGEQDSVEFETDISGPDGKTRVVHNQFVTLEFGNEMGRVGVTRDVTERKRYEERLRALYDSSRELIEADTPAAISEILVETASTVLDLPGLVVYRYDDERDLLVAESESVEADFMREEFPTVPPDDSSLTGEVYASGEPRYYENVLESPYLGVAPDETKMRAGLFVPLGEEGILVAGSRDTDGFDASTRPLVELLATNAKTAYDRVARKQELTRQRAQLEALNSLNEVAREITGAVIDQSTREEIERTACQHLADSESYLFAWIGEADTVTQTVDVRAEAGVEGYLDDITISVDPDDARSEGPTERAFRTGETQVVHDVYADSQHDPWREYVEQYGFRSSAAVPIVHEGTVYGVLNVYADRPDAFESTEQEVIGQLGEVVGHAIAAIERKRALTSNEITEIEFTIPDVAEFAGLETEIDGTITFDRAVPTGDGTYLEYGTVDVDAIDALEALVSQLPYFEEVTISDQGRDTARFELRLSEPPVVSVIASHGGYLQQGILKDDGFHLTVHLPVTVEARRIIDAVQEAYPTADLIKRRQITRSDDTLARAHHALTEDLTERQRATLEAAYYAGFFHWPRDATGEEIAESLGIAPPTFSQHLRKSQRKVFESLFTMSP